LPATTPVVYKLYFGIRYQNVCVYICVIHMCVYILMALQTVWCTLLPLPGEKNVPVYKYVSALYSKPSR